MSFRAPMGSPVIMLIPGPRGNVPDVPRLADVIAVLDGLYDPSRAEHWDAVGLVCGDPDAEVERVLLAIDPVSVVAEEAVEWRADLLVTHHPLFLRPVHGAAATPAEGRRMPRPAPSR